MGRLYRVREFAALTGVTVRALHYYDRLGLLKPSRTRNGYRLYSAGDLERLEQIVALKFLGLPLKQIKRLLDWDRLQLRDALRLQRKVLEDKRWLLDRAIGAIQSAERAIEAGKAADPAVLKKIIEVIEMQNNVDHMKQYYSDVAWTKWAERHYQSPPAKEWIDLYRDVEASLAEDPAGEKAQALASRWITLSQSEAGGDPEIQIGLMRAWADRSNWPAAMRDQRLDSFNLELAAEFIGKALTGYRQNYYTDEAWAKMTEPTREAREKASVAWFELLVDVRASLDEDPAGDKAQALAARWSELSDSTSGGDPAIKASHIRAWADRQQWPPAAQQWMASIDLERVAEFIGKALAACMKKYYSEEAWAKLMNQSDSSRAGASQEWIAFYQDVAASLDEDPASANAQALAARWVELSETSMDGDPEIKAGAARAWAHRGNWPGSIRQTVASRYQMDFETYEKAAEFIKRAIVCRSDWRDRREI